MTISLQSLSRICHIKFRANTDEIYFFPLDSILPTVDVIANPVFTLGHAPVIMTNIQFLRPRKFPLFNSGRSLPRHLLLKESGRARANNNNKIKVFAIVIIFGKLYVAFCETFANWTRKITLTSAKLVVVLFRIERVDPRKYQKNYGASFQNHALHRIHLNSW